MTLKMHPLFALLLLGYGFADALELPKGWIIPRDSSFYGAWRKPSPTRYLAAATDINCDGFVDSILILQPEKGRGLGLFAFLQDGNGQYRSSQLFDSRKEAAGLKDLSEKEKAELQWWYRSLSGVKAVERGIYPTACGQGYRACGKDEKRKIEIECGGIDFFPFKQGGDRYFYWNRSKKRILSAVMTD
ncbi:MAG: hypothetical protein JWP91_1418 [Fibrobacteres bacterium]|nr:hypothetical protein [Fibrobacterota bacterium]